MTRSWLDRLWSSIADRGGAWVSIPDASPLEQVRNLARDLLSGRGEASGAAIARELLGRYRHLPAEDRLAFHQYLAEGFYPEPEQLRAAAAAYIATPNAETAMRLAESAEPPRQELIRRINMGQGGTAALVEMRREILTQLRDHPELKPLDSDLRHLLGSWFNRGFLDLRRIDWDSSAAVLEKLINYEAVHEIKGWTDLQRRLQRDRRCFGFFHPALPGEPLIFVEVALTAGLADKVDPLLAQQPPTDEDMANADTAIFYSISNCQEGLRGISFGNFLIKQVVEELRAELPRLVRFSTLSPVPGFRRWLTSYLPEHPEEGLPETGVDWPADEATQELLKPVLLRLCATYLAGLAETKDPVARFHLGNGARLERINWRANLSPRGVRESYGVMVNYLYDPETIEANHEAFVRQGQVARSAAVTGLLQAPAPPKRGSRLTSLVPTRKSKTVPA